MAGHHGVGPTDCAAQLPFNMSERDETPADAGVDTESTAGRRDTILQQVVEAVAAETEATPTDLPPLYEVVDPDLLERLTDHPTTADEPVYLRFPYCGCTVVVDSNGDVTVTPADDE